MKSVKKTILDSPFRIKATLGNGQVVELNAIDGEIIHHNRHSYDFFTLLNQQSILMSANKTKNNGQLGSVGDVIIWLLAETGEVLNESKFFKYCRDKSINRNRLLEEFTDCVFLYLELAVRTNFHKSYGCLPGGVNYDLVASESELYSEFSRWVRTISKAYNRYACGDKDYVCVLHRSMDTLFSLLNFYGFTEQDVIDMYNKKYEVNLLRLKEFVKNA